jgi:hypothetical protein
MPAADAAAPRQRHYALPPLCAIAAPTTAFAAASLRRRLPHFSPLFAVRLNSLVSLFRFSLSLFSLFHAASAISIAFSFHFFLRHYAIADCRFRFIFADFAAITSIAFIFSLSDIFFITPCRRVAAEMFHFLFD